MKWATGQLAFPGDSTALIFDAILNRTPVPPSQRNANVPPECERNIYKALEKDRDLRYQHASELRADLQRLKRDADSGRSSPAISGSAQSAAFAAQQSAGRVPAAPATKKIGKFAVPPRSYRCSRLSQEVCTTARQSKRQSSPPKTPSSSPISTTRPATPFLTTRCARR
jgi:serine/threonine protein kinase